MSNNPDRPSDPPQATVCHCLNNWPDIVAPLINVINTEHFYKTLIEVINRIAPIDSAIVMIFRQDEKPTLLYDGLYPGEVASFYDVYLAGAYLLSPLYQQYRSLRSGFYRMEGLTASKFRCSEFDTAYYNDLGLCDEGNLLVKINEDTSVAACFGRQQLRMKFTDSELRHLHVAEPVFRAAIEKHWQDVAVATQDAITARKMHKQLQAMLHNFASSLLTGRERDVLALMFAGKASKAAAKALNISPETERGHRKNIYAKLEVASQAELFSLLFSVLTEMDSIAEEDPLVSYRNKLK